MSEMEQATESEIERCVFNGGWLGALNHMRQAMYAVAAQGNE
jgi:hypothetical protein